MGKFSRDKGRRAEYHLRDYAISLGFTAVRVPLSGASQGFKGDLHIKDKNSTTLVIEAKSRKDSFKVLYEGLETNPAFFCTDNCDTAQISTDFVSVFYGTKGAPTFKKIPASRFTRKVRKLKELLGGADILAVRDDRKPWIFIRYYA